MSWQQIFRRIATCKRVYCVKKIALPSLHPLFNGHHENAEKHRFDPVYTYHCTYPRPLGFSLLAFCSQPSSTLPLFFYGIILVCVLTQCLNIHLIFAGCFGTCYLERWQNDAKYFGKA